MTGDSYIDRARERGWLLSNDSVATPATTNHTQDLQLRMTLEPVNNLKIDLNASRTQTTAKSIQYMYQGNPTTQSGSFTMTTLSLGSAFEGMGDAANGYHSATSRSLCARLMVTAIGWRRSMWANSILLPWAEVSLILPRVLLTSIVAT